MSSKKKNQRGLVLALLPVLLVVFVSGCTTDSVGTGKGVVISAFEPDFAQINSGERVSLQLKMQNMGEVRARDVSAELSGIDPQTWNFYGTADTMINFGDLLAPDTVSNTPGQIRSAEWIMFAPELPQGTNFAYTPIVRVSYDYQTVAHKPIMLIDENELRRIIQQGRGSLATGKPTENSAGPFTVTVAAGDYVKTSGPGGQTRDIFPIHIHISNDLWETGGSVAPLINEPASYPVLVTVEEPSGTEFFNSGSYLSDCSGTMIVDLWKGKDADITCELEVVSPPPITTEDLMKITLDYRFFIDARTNINVVGQTRPY
ncbi:MAG: hypothetical protein ABIJ92_05035 [Candidatus Aenigmatarchaeota archaeon]